MKVTCSRCGTEYNFDDSKVTEDGVKVKCTRCENVFRVRKKAFVVTEPMQSGDETSIPPDPEPSAGLSEPGIPVSGTPPATAPMRKWYIRKTSGETLEFNEMTTLQRWIVEQRVESDDEISHNGSKWKRLGAISELEPFFNVVSRPESPSPVPSSTWRQETAAPSARAEPSAEPPSIVPRPRGPDDRGRLEEERNAPKRRGGAIFASLVLIAAVAGGAGWAQMSEPGRKASGPAREWLAINLGLDLRLPPPGTPIPEPTAAADADPEGSPSPEETELAIAETPSPTPTAEPVKTSAPTRLTVDQMLRKGYEAYAQGQYREAIRHYQDAVNASPENSEAYALLGLAYLDSEQDDLAESTLEASIRLNPRFADAHRYLGLLYSGRGDKPRAVQAFNNYLDLRPNGPTSEDVRKRVASLQGG